MRPILFSVVETMQTTTALLALIALAGAIVLIIARLFGAGRPAVASLGSRMTRLRTPLTFAIASVSMVGSLYFSEVEHYLPCRLCWFQRVAMYPIALIALVGLIRKDRHARWYIVPFAAIGVCISTYHYLIEWGVLSDSESCALFGPSCADVWFREFGFISLAAMAWAGFVAIMVLNTVSFEPAESSEEAM